MLLQNRSDCIKMTVLTAEQSCNHCCNVHSSHGDGIIFGFHGYCIMDNSCCGNELITFPVQLKSMVPFRSFCPFCANCMGKIYIFLTVPLLFQGRVKASKHFETQNHEFVRILCVKLLVGCVYKFKQWLLGVAKED